MEALYLQNNKLLQEVQNNLGRLERAHTAEEVTEIENELQARIEDVITGCDRLDILVNKEPPNRRASAKLRVDQLKYDCQHVQSAMRNIQSRRYTREEDERAREALLTTNFVANNSSSTSIHMDAELQQHQNLQNSHRQMDDLLTHGSSIIGNLRDQRGMLKGVHKKMLDVANTLGLSNTVMRLIERRTTQDKVILYGGMVLTLVIMFFIWKYFA
ncbi:hypothetical protein CAPTEDRAFT_152195 [Capitella teleta]|uniref:Golgi SNAP receptor complex member 2 n=1 Tax=Capitella teleta TaxID=283909 RepID=R7TL43_CAPTE|nr:hypothetical protein CAPTEDRAFT_152195 [Capitella teleta]|eukprot:ELT94374.1 hypothetical protein CAPTEDRAFT_152195 [Capitella teleta]